MANCQAYGCKAPATLELLFTSGMHGQYCSIHAAFFVKEIIVEVVPVASPQQPRQPLEEKDAEIERLQLRIASYESLCRSILRLLENQPVDVHRLAQDIRTELSVIRC